MGTSGWPSGQGEMALRIGTYNWTATPLGPTVAWPQNLKAAVELMLASAFPMSILWGQEAIILYNDAKARLLGKFHPAALGQSAFEALLVIPHGLEPVIHRVMSGESVVFGEQRYVVQGKSGEREMWVDHLASPMRSETGAIAGLWMVLIDVTTRIQAERQRQDAEDARRQSEARQAFLLRISDEMREIADPAAIMAAATRMTGEHFGASRCCCEEICGSEIRLRGSWGREMIPTPENFVLATFAAPAAGGGIPGRAVVVADVGSDPRLTEQERESLGAARTAAFVCVPLRGGGVLGVQSEVPRAWTAAEVELIRELGERIWHAVRRARAEAALRDSEERFRQFAEASTDIIWIRDAKTLQLEYWSPSFEHGFGDKWDPTLGGDNLKDWLDIIVPADRERTLEAIAAVQARERVIFEKRIKRPSDGEIRWTRNHLFPLLDGAGSVQRIGTICHDITEEKATADRMQNLVAELQHRTRNLMAVLQSLVTRTLAASEDFDSFKMRIDERLMVMSRVHDLLSRSEEEPVTIGALVQLEIGALGNDVPAGRIEVSGPEVTIRNSTVQMMAFALHELAIDARKHGALSMDRGSLKIGWEVEQIRGASCLRLSWIEECPIGVGVGRDPRGYARELIERALRYSLNAETRYALDEAGLQCTISLPLTKEGLKERGA